MIQMIQSTVQFSGHMHDDPNAHISNFLELCDTFKINGVSDDAIRLRLFPFSLWDKAKSWLHSLPVGSITTWDVLAQKFLAKYFPPSKTAKMRNDITSFMQMDMETLYEAWEHFKELLRRCPHHQLPVWLQVQTFYNGLSPTNRSMIDAAAGGTINQKMEEEAFDLIDEMASNSYQWQTECMMPKRLAAVQGVDCVPTLLAEIAALRAEVNNLKGTAMHVQSITCDLCGGGHDTSNCQTGNPFAKTTDTANYIGNFFRPQQNNPYSNTYNQGWRQHPNFSWSNQNAAQQPPPGFQVPEKKSNMEELMVKFMQNQEATIKNLEAKLRQDQTAAIRNLEMQIGQMAKIISERPQGSLPSNTETNPREQVNAITLRSGTKLEEPHQKKETEEPTTNKEPSTKIRQSPKQPADGWSPGIRFADPNVKPYVPPLPFPERQIQHPDKEFSNFFKILKNLHINIPFVDAITQMPRYAKFLKEILTNKKKLKEHERINLNEECSAILQNKLPQKLKDPGSFTIPCIIGDCSFDKVLCDLGASINLMPFSIFRKLGLGEPKPTTITLQLADRSIKYPRGIVEDVLVKVNKFIFPVDFIVLDMEEDYDVPLILGRPFLATGGALIDVQQEKLILRVQDE